MALSTLATAPAAGIALATATADNPVAVLLHGNARLDSWDWTVGGLVYLDSGGGLTQTQPDGTDEVIQVVGIAHPNADTLYVNPQLTYITHT